MGPVGFAAAGGGSRRMGSDKALLPWGDGGTLLGHALERLRACCPVVRILPGPTSRYPDQGLPLVLDRRPGLGPVGGLLAALESLADEPGLILAVDLPFVESDLLRYLLAESEGFDAAVPLTPDGPQPLCAVYRRRCLGAVERAVARGALRMTDFWPEASVRLLGPADLARFGDPARLFRNLNTPEDYAAVRP